MISLPIGFILTTAFIVLAMGLESLPLYINMHAIMIVIGGSISILVFTAPISTLKNLFRSIWALFGKDTEVEDLLPQIRELSANKQTQTPFQDPLLQYAAELWQQGVDSDMFIVLLSQRREKLENEEMEAVQALKNLAKYPPALGMAGTVMGLVTLFSNLNADSKSQIGPALALAMTATFFGLVLANGLVMPLADRLQVRQIRRKHHFTSLYQILLLINRDEPLSLITEELRQRAA